MCPRVIFLALFNTLTTETLVVISCTAQFKPRKINMTTATPPAPRITVITHNGKPPSEGGLRVAYQANDCAGFISIPGAYMPLDHAIANWQRFGTTYPQPAAPTAPAKPEPKSQRSSVTKTIVFFDLPIGYSGYCPSCDTSNRDTGTKVFDTSDCGEMRITVCWKCGAKFRKR